MSVNHVYSATVGSYTVTFTELGTGCVMNRHGSHRGEHERIHPDPGRWSYPGVRSSSVGVHQQQYERFPEHGIHLGFR